ncbi:XrtA system polysaccharide chain length determinant [Sphingosinicella sp. YJ22]|uniref:XrtA system polysaccharide chain length determinant n=1 Tax=Sphingosinicella sp. YJ22 TaxID=1104780 RepID=UPI00140E3B09|nr:XrtA system polysaccharide chain length determinant [Sphingosinicella sp. YJ22]
MDGLYEQFRIALHQVWQRRWLAMAVAWCVAFSGWVVIALIPNSYQAKAKLFVAFDNMVPTAAAASQNPQNDILRLKQTLTSNENLTRVVRRTDLNKLVTSDAALGGVVAGLRQRIAIVAQPDSLFEITATSSFAGLSNAENARTSAAIAQQLVEIFTSGEIAGDPQRTQQSLTFLDEELRRREQQLQEAEQRRMEFEQRYMGMLPGTGSVADRMSAARTELAQLEQTIVAARSAVNAMRGQLAATPATVPIPGAENAYGGTASGQVAGLEVQLNQYLGRGFTEQHPDVISLRSQIARLGPQAAQERSRGSAGGNGIPNPSHVSLRAMMSEREAQLAAAESRRAQLQADLAQLGQRDSAQPGAAAEQARLTRDYDVLRQQYDRLLADREQLRLRSDMQTQASAMVVRVVEAPRAPSGPTSPNRPLFLTIVLVLAVGAGIAAAFLKGQLQTTFPTATRLAAVTGLPVLGAVGEVVGRAERTRRRQRLVWLAGSGGALAASYALLMAAEMLQRGPVA